MRFKILLEGGLGNQMFQYAFGRSLAKKYNAELHLSTSLLMFGNPSRPYMLESMFGISHSEGIGIDWNRQISELHPYIDGCELNYDSIEDGNYLIRGYWQNENYFSYADDQIREDFRLESVKMSDSNLLVQIRRTDFVNNLSHEYCNIDWYKKAISHFDFDTIYFTSDDIEWCRRNFNYPNMKFIIGNERTQFMHMYGFEKFVISNSSFGWWGSWFSDSENVVCPEIWFPGDIRWNTARKKWKKLSK